MTRFKKHIKEKFHKAISSAEGVSTAFQSLSEMAAAATAPIGEFGQLQMAVKTEMKPILFNTEMVRAILDGRKTVTRRVVPERLLDKYYDYDDWCNSVMPRDVPCTRTYERDFFMDRAPYQPGNILYVRETWRPLNPKHPITEGHNVEYAEQWSPKYFENSKLPTCCNAGKWRPSIHMPKEAARIFLRVTNVRVERLCSITDDSCFEEGIKNLPFSFPRLEFKELWDGTIPKKNLDRYGWAANPWVWVYEFERCEKPE